LRIFPLILFGGIIAEIWVFIKAGEAFGAFPVILAVIASMIAGASVIRWQGIKTLTGLRSALNGGSLREVNAAHGALIYLAGMLLILPGFLTDLAAIALLIAPVRRIIMGYLRSRVDIRTTTHVWPSNAHRRPPIIEGEAVEVAPKPVSDKNSPWQV
jgi:UPF0716 protein FxsA